MIDIHEMHYNFGAGFCSRCGDYQMMVEDDSCIGGGRLYRLCLKCGTWWVYYNEWPKPPKFALGDNLDD